MGKYKKEVTRYLLDHIDIVDVVGSRTSLKRAGRNHKGLCPFHGEKTPSFVVSSEKQTYHCFGCGAHGNALGFVMETENMGFLDALEHLADRHHLDLSTYLETDFKRQSDDTKGMYEVMTQAARLYYKALTQSQKAQAYFKDRGLEPGVMKRFGLGFAPDSWDFCLSYFKKQGVSEDLLLKCGLIVKNDKGRYYDRFRNRVMFPIFDQRGRVVAFGGRVLDDSLPKYLNSPETPIFYKSNTLYGLNIARKEVNKKRQIILVEGYMDVITLNQYGFTNAVASLGTALTENHVKQLSRVYQEVYFAYDGDEAGRKAIEKSLDELAKYDLKVRIVDMGDAKDPDELLKSGGAGALRRQIDAAMNTIDFSIKRLEMGYNLSDDEDRLRFLNQAYDLIGHLASETEREIYLTKLSERLKLERSNVIADFNRLDKSQGVQVPGPATSEAHSQDDSQGWEGIDFDPPEVVDEEIPSDLSETPLINPSKLFKIEKAVLKCALVSKGNIAKIEQDLAEGFYYHDHARLLSEIKAYYGHHDTFDLLLASEHFGLDQVMVLKDIMSGAVAITHQGDVQTLLTMHQKLYYQARIEEIDQLIQRLRMTPGDEAALKYREKLVERISLVKALSKVSKQLMRGH